MPFAGLEGLMAIGSTDDVALSIGFPKEGSQSLVSDL